MLSCSIQQTMDYIFLYSVVCSIYSHHTYIPAPSYHLYTHIKSEQLETNFPNFRIRSNNSENAIWPKKWKNAPLISLWWLRIWRKDLWVLYIYNLSSNPLDRSKIYALTCTHIEAQYDSLEIFTAKNMGTGLSIGSGTESVDFWIWFALLVVHEYSHRDIIVETFILELEHQH